MLGRHSITDNITEKRLLTAITAMCEARERAGAEGSGGVAAPQ